MRQDKDSRMVRTRRAWLALAMGGLAVGGAVSAAPLGALAGVASGRWALKEIGGTQTRALCVASADQLLQVGHEGSDCTRTVVDDGPRSLVVSHVCTGGGSGRTALTVLSPRLLRLEVQGMRGGAPFAVDYDARRIGDCS